MATFKCYDGFVLPLVNPNDSDLYKQAKEYFVTGHTGTSMGHILMITWIPLLALLVPRLFLNISSSRQSFVDICAVLTALLVGVTFFPYELTTLFITLVMVRVGQSLFSGITLRQCRSSVTHALKQDATGGHDMITIFRSVLLIQTLFAILAIDFPIFPRSFAKVETFGTSLMDTGVGAFVFSSGLVLGVKRRKTGAFSASLLHSLPLIVLGMARFVTTSAVDYQVHASEYGVHWNFFLTLAALQILTPCIPTTKISLHQFLIGLIIALAYQFALTAHGLTEYIIHYPRTSFFHANKEGFCSIAGYVAIYQMALAIGQWVGEMIQRSNISITRRMRTLAMLCTLDLVLWCLAWYTHTYVQFVSRRMANLAYVLWTVAFNLFHLLACLFICVAGKFKASPLLSAINRNQLPLFLIANLLTGAINLGFVTIYASVFHSIGILVAYLLLIFAIGLFLHHTNRTIRL